MRDALPNARSATFSKIEPAALAQITRYEWIGISPFNLKSKGHARSKLPIRW